MPPIKKSLDVLAYLAYLETFRGEVKNGGVHEVSPEGGAEISAVRVCVKAEQVTVILPQKAIIIDHRSENSGMRL